MSLPSQQHVVKNSCEMRIAAGGVTHSGPRYRFLAGSTLNRAIHRYGIPVATVIRSLMI